MYMYVNKYTYINTHTYLSIYIYIYLHIFVYKYIGEYIYACIYSHIMQTRLLKTIHCSPKLDITLQQHLISLRYTIKHGGGLVISESTQEANA